MPDNASAILEYIAIQLDRLQVQAVAIDEGFLAVMLDQAAQQARMRERLGTADKIGTCSRIIYLTTEACSGKVKVKGIGAVHVRPSEPRFPE